MKGCLAGIGALFLILLVGLGGFFVYGFIKLIPIEKDAKLYARDTITAIASTWDGEALLAKASDELRASVKAGEIDQLMNKGIQSVGALTELGEVSCNASFNKSVGEGTIFTADCSGEGNHERGTVAYSITIKKYEESPWELYRFNFSATPFSDTETSI